MKNISAFPNPHAPAKAQSPLSAQTESPLSKRGFVIMVITALLCGMLMSVAASAQSTALKEIRFTFSGAATATIQDSIPTGITVTATSADSSAISNVSARLEKVSFSGFQTLNDCSQGTILAPAQNAGYGNVSGSAISYLFRLSGLKAVMPNFDEVDLGVCGLNVSGKYQNSNNDTRAFTFSVGYGANKFANENLPTATGDLMRNAYNNGENFQYISVSDTASVPTTEPLYLSITLTKEAELGCYAGLRSITIKDTRSDTTVIDSSATHSFSAEAYYKIYNFSNNSLYMGADASGNLMVMADEEANRVWWQFIPTTNADCYYIRNATTGQYVQALQAKGPRSYISLGSNPVEYYIGLNEVSGARTNGAYWLSSTNTAGYSEQSSSTLALNKDGASDHVLTWTASGSEPNSYWYIVKSDYDYDPTPFLPSTGQHLYFVKSAATAKALVSSGSSLGWAAQAMDKSQQWYFSGVSNKQGGYRIYNSASGVAIDTLHYIIEQSLSGYTFRHKYEPRTALVIDGDSVFYFEEARSSFSLSAQIYNMPCGTLNQPRLKSASLKGEGVRTPLIVADDEITPQGANTVWTKSRPVVVAGSTGTLTISLNQAPDTGVEAWLYFDWDRDGFFEQSLKLETSQNITQTLSFPAVGEGNAREGQSHIRLRLNNTGLNGAEDDVIGQSIDFIITLTSDNAPFTAKAAPNDSTRGSAAIVGTTATASSYNNCRFVCWKEQNKVVSTSETYAFTLDHDVNLTAVFSADPDNPTSVSSINKSADKSVVIKADGKTVRAEASSPVNNMRIYDINGMLVGRGTEPSLSVASLNKGVYIIRVQTANGQASTKLSID